jgi:hypothetical protein
MQPRQAKLSLWWFHGCCFTIMALLMMQRAGVWGQTIPASNYTHAIQFQNHENRGDQSSILANAGFLAAAHAWHRLALPIAVASFYTSFGVWLLISVENRALKPVAIGSAEPSVV